MEIETKLITFSLPGKTLVLNVVKDIEKLITDPTDADKVPCWADIWPAARGMSLYIWNCIEISGNTVLELGAGLGLPGITCGLKGAKVTFSDLNNDALKIAVLNAAQNNISKNIDTFLGDWRNFSCTKKYDWIIGSDILYDPKLTPFIHKIIKSNLKPNGQLIFSHPHREVSFQFIDTLCRNTHCKEKRINVPVTIDDPYFPHYNICIHHIKLLDLRNSGQN